MTMERHAADMLADLGAMGHVLCRKEHPKWVEFVARYVRRRRSKEGEVLSHLEGDGPPRREVRRPPVNLMTDFGHLPVTVGRRKALLGRLDWWLRRAFRLTLEELLDKPLEQADFLMASFGQRCYDSGVSLYGYTERRTARAWDVAKTWRRLTQARSHRPVPLVVLLAMQALALEREWDLYAGALDVGF